MEYSLMNITIQLRGGCQCGSIQYDISGLPFDADYCHCSICRKSSGSIVMSWMDFKVEQINWLSEKPIEYKSSKNARRGFCQKCGSTLSFRDTHYPDYYSLSIASLNDPNQVKPNYHIYTDDQIEWLTIKDECKRYPKSRS